MASSRLISASCIRNPSVEFAAGLIFRQPGKALALGVRERAALLATFTSAYASRRRCREMLFATLHGLRTGTTNSFRPSDASGAAVAYTVVAPSVGRLNTLHRTLDRTSIERSGGKNGQKEENGGNEFHSSLAPYESQ
jgi:hypothetical protein